MIEKNKLGVGLFLVSEANFFLLLILAYVYYRGAASPGPTASSALNPVAAGLNTLCLVGSSITMWRAERSLGRADGSRLCAWLLATVVLGAVFLIGQGREYVTLITQNVTISRDLFGTTFFTLTGFHGLHVLVGLVALTILLGLALAGDFTGGRSSAVESVALYWHFVDIVWLVIFSIVYVGAVV